MSVGGDNRPFQPKYYQYGKCERPSNGQYGLKVPILHNTTTQSTSPLDIWGDSTVTTGTASNAFDYTFSQVKSVKVTNGGTGWSTGDTFTPHFADGTNTTPPYAGYPYPMASDNHGVSFPLLECTATSGSDGVMVSASIVRNSAGCFFSGAVMDDTAVSPSAGGSGATIALTFESASYDFGANCCQTGHGYVAACRSWHGCPGFLDSNMGGFAERPNFAAQLNWIGWWCLAISRHRASNVS